ncbi:hypothetical protein [Shewanella woodyi]|uniref:hypothetical protein n=1 Tax=Shewanella woodyi TaxID=60961 RepID=UPI0012FA606E|nr:hypothetical protein [Shewanella woodyi]
MIFLVFFSFFVFSDALPKEVVNTYDFDNNFKIVESDFNVVNKVVTIVGPKVYQDNVCYRDGVLLSISNGDIEFADEIKLVHPYEIKDIQCKKAEGFYLLNNSLDNKTFYKAFLLFEIEIDKFCKDLESAHLHSRESLICNQSKMGYIRAYRNKGRVIVAVEYKLISKSRAFIATLGLVGSEAEFSIEEFID